MFKSATTLNLRGYGGCFFCSRCMVPSYLGWCELYQFGFMHRALLPVCFCFIDVGLLALVSHLQRRIF